MQGREPARVRAAAPPLPQSRRPRSPSLSLTLLPRPPHSAVLRGTPVAARPTARRVAAPAARAPLTVDARYRGVGTDLSKVPSLQRSPSDTGSSEVQVARLSARVLQLTSHLQTHRKDYAATRGLMAVLSQRRRLLRYLYTHDRAMYERCLAELGVRPLKANAGRGVMVKLGGVEAAVAQ